MASLEESCYMEISGPKWDNLLDSTKNFINVLIPAFYEKTGVKVYLTSGWREYSSNGSQHHMNGEAFDVAGDELNDMSLRNLYGEMAKQTGDCSPLDEYYSAGVEGAEWWDGSYWDTSGDNFHITVHGDPTGTPTGGGGASDKLDPNSRKIQSFINWCVQTANEEPHLYVLGGEGPDNFDCTGFLSYGLQQAGFDIAPCHGDAFDSGVEACGFQRIDYSDDQGTDPLQPGDILSCSHHVELYIGGGQVVGAHCEKANKADEVSVEGWFPDQWTEIYRFPGISGVTGPNGDGVQGNKNGRYNKFQSLLANSYMSHIRDLGSAVELLPSKKTYCEPMYPDYIYVQGNIPCSAIEKTTIDRASYMEPSGSYALMTGQVMQDLTGMKNTAFTTPNAQALAQRQFDPTKAELEVKVSNQGKPLNNNDPFPVDLKIEELERHLPRVKQYKLPYNRKCGVSKTISSAILKISDWTEKRIVRLENLLSTTMRYVYGMGSRMFINCQYYGGQDHRSKYCCIRCLKDDRTDDGQIMTIDQCLSCSRFEPIIGQTYDILNEVGANLSNIEDDCQGGFMSMDDMITFLRVEKMHDKKKTYKLNYQTTDKKNPNERKFKDDWEEGSVMDWKLTPVEQQKPQINWRPDINHEDKTPKKLDSYQAGPGQNSDEPGSTLKPGKDGDMVQKQLQQMNYLLEIKRRHDAGEDTPEYEANIHAIMGVYNGFQKADQDNVDKALDTMKNNGFEQEIQNSCTDKKADPITMFTLATIASCGDPGAGTNEKGGLYMREGITPWQTPHEQTDKMIDIVNGTGKGKGNNPMGYAQALVGWNDALEKLNAEDAIYSEQWAVAAGDQAAFFPEFIKVYDMIRQKSKGSSQTSTNINGGIDGAHFPVYTKDLYNTYFIQDYGANCLADNVVAISNGIMLKMPAGTELHAPCDGEFTGLQDDEQMGKYTTIFDKTCNITFTFGGLSSLDATSVKQGDVFAKSNETLMVKTQGEHGYIDPKGTWTKLCNKVSLDESLGTLIEKENRKQTENI